MGLIELGMNVVALHTWVCLGGHFKYSNIYKKGAIIATRHTTFLAKNNIWSYFQTLHLEESLNLTIFQVELHKLGPQPCDPCFMFRCINH